MKKLYLILSLLFLLACCLPLTAQHTVECGAPGTSITFNKFELSSLRRVGCIVEYDITITASETGAYRIEALGLTLISFNVSNPGIVNFAGEANTVFPCILLTRFLDELDIYTPSGSCTLNVSALLPVRLLSFTAEEASGDALLKWSTATELNNEGFLIEHTQTGASWNELGFVPGAGTTDEIQEYTYRIDDLPAGEHYFRLKQVDFDGSFEYSPVANLYLGSGDNAIRIFPNPLPQGQPLNIQGTFDRAELFNAAGQRLLRFQSPDAFHGRQFQELPAGFYQLVIESNGQRIKQKLIIN